MILRLLLASSLFRFAAVFSAVTLAMLVTPAFPFHVTAIPMLLMSTVMFSFERATRFEAIIPVDARRVFLVRTGVGLVLTCAPLIAWIITLSVRQMPDITLMPDPGVMRKLQLVALPIAALAVILPHARQPGVLPLPGHRPLPTFPWWGILAIGAAAVAGPLPAGIASLLLASMAVGMLVHTYRRMPRSFQLAPVEQADGGKAAHRRTSSTSVGPAAVRWWRPLVRNAMPGYMWGIALIIGLAAVGNVWVLFLLFYWLPGLFDRNNMQQWLQTLPVRPAVLLWTKLAPAAFALMAVAVVSFVDPMARLRVNPLVGGEGPHQYSRNDQFDRRTIVPLAFWKIAPKGDVPLAHAPWGEKTVTDTITLPFGTLYNPYSAAVGSSAELVEWQFARASAAVHGRSFTTADYHEDEFVAPPMVTKSFRVFLLSASLAVTFVILLAWIAELFRWHVLVKRTVLRRAAAVGTGAIVLVIVGLELVFRTQHDAEFFISAGAALAMFVATSLPNFGAVALVAVIPVAAAYSLLRWQFGQSDRAQRD